MRAITTPGTVLLLAAVLSNVSAARAAIPQKKEYLSEAEADKIRDAGMTGPRIVLYAKFAGDRIKKLQYEFAHMDLPYLQDLAAKGPERETYKDNLDDAIEATQDAAKDVEKASKEMAPPPVRRKPS